MRGQWERRGKVWKNSDYEQLQCAKINTGWCKRALKKMLQEFFRSNSKSPSVYRIGGQGSEGH